jgi:hypothetical protein
VYSIRYHCGTLPEYAGNDLDNGQCRIDKRSNEGYFFDFRFSIFHLLVFLFGRNW